MKKQLNLQLITVLGGGILFNALFWMERLALNLLIYSVFVICSIYFDRSIVKSKKMLVYLSAHFLSAALVVYNQSDLTLATWYFSLAIFVGFAHGTAIRSIFTAICAACWQAFSAPVNFALQLADIRIGNYSLKPVFKLIKYLVIPTFLILLFIVIYCNANRDFARYMEIFGDKFALLLVQLNEFFFADFSFLRVLHLLLGFLLTTAILIGVKNHFIQNAELSLTEKMVRNRRKKKTNNFFQEIYEMFAGKLLTRKLALKTENVIGILSFVSLNLLLLFVNLIDIYKLWLGKEIRNISYSADVHDGTNALIFSILMAMAVILYFFKGNLNFYIKNKLIKILAYTWIAQNAFLITSVFLRDYNYIAAHGLTHKRIGVLVFLLLCSIGLLTVYIKVAKQKTLFYLFKVNGLSWYIILICACFINWDVKIASYNIGHAHTISVDVPYLLELSNKTLPIIDQNKAFLMKLMDNDGARSGRSLLEKSRTRAYYTENIDRRINWFKERWQETSWLSWDYRDWQTHQYFTSKKD